MTSVTPIIPQALNAKPWEASWDYLPYGIPGITPDFHGMSVCSGYTISQLTMPTACFAKKMLSQNGTLTSNDSVYKMVMEELGAYLTENELWHVVEGIYLRQNAENIGVHGGEEFRACLASNGLRARELHSGSMDDWVVASRGHENEIREDMSDPEPKPQPQPQPRPGGDPWGYGYPMQGGGIGVT